MGPDYGSYWQGLVINHVVTRSVRDCASVLDCVSGPMPGDPYVAPPPARNFMAEVGSDPGALRIGLMSVAPGRNQPVDPECAAAVEAAGSTLAELGHRVETSHPAALDEVEERNAHFTTIVVSWTAAALEEWEAITGKSIPEGGIEPLTATLATVGQAVTATQYVAATKWMERFARRMAAWWEDDFDVLVTPMLGTPPPELGVLVSPDGDLGPVVETLDRVAPFASSFNITGQPAVSLPLHWTDSGLPVGVQFVAKLGREDVLLRLAAQLEEAMPWQHRRPPICVA